MAELLELQRLAGNAAVSELIVQRDAPASTSPADAPTREPVPAAALPDPSKTIPPPPPKTGIEWSPVGEGEGPHRGVDIAADAKNVTITFVYKDWNFPESEDGAVIDWLHEPNVSIQVSPAGTPDPVVQAALSAINLHLRHHAKDIVEISVSPQVGVPTNDPSKTSVGVQAQAEFHVTATFSITASSTVSGSKNPDTGRVDIAWEPVSIGVLYHLESDKAKEAPHRADQADGTIGWIESNFDASTFDDGGKEDNLKDAEDAIIARMIASMSEARGKDVARLDIDLGPRARPLPDRMEEGLTELVRLIKFSHPELESIAHVQVSVLRRAPGSTATTLMRFFDVRPGPKPGVPGDYPMPKKRQRMA